MIDKNKDFFINNPIFIKYKTYFSFSKFTRVREVRRVFINERIVEIPFVLQNIPQRKDLLILDLGCVESPLPLYLASLGYNILGLDYRNYPYFHPNLRFVRANALQLPFKEEIFDIVISVSTLEHIGLGYYEDPTMDGDSDFKVVREIYRVLKKKGLAIITLPFGRKYQVSSQQRIYSQERLNILFTDFLIQTQQFFINFEGKNNYWSLCEEARVQEIELSQNGTNCVCLLKAVKEG